MANPSSDIRTSMAEVDGLLVVSLPSELSDGVLNRIVRDVTERAAAEGIRGVILNLSTVMLLDLTEFGVLRQLVQTNEVLGVPTVLMGIRPGIAAYLCRVDMASALEACDG
jgi:rsbT antagonist protein RsbS